MDSKDLAVHAFVKNKHKTMIGGQKKIVFGGPRVRKQKKGFRKVRTKFQKVILVPSIKRKVQVLNTNRKKGRGSDQKREGKEGAIP